MYYNYNYLLLTVCTFTIILFVQLFYCIYCKYFSQFVVYLFNINGGFFFWHLGMFFSFTVSMFGAWLLLLLFQMKVLIIWLSFLND